MSAGDWFTTSHEPLSWTVMTSLVPSPCTITVPAASRADVIAYRRRDSSSWKCMAFLLPMGKRLAKCVRLRNARREDAGTSHELHPREIRLKWARSGQRQAAGLCRFRFGGKGGG